MIKILDLFCGAGGAAMGYYQACKESGIDCHITGIDINPMKRYPFQFVQADALEFLAQHGGEYDFIHASPPCQAYSMATTQWRKSGKKYPDLLEKTRGMVIKTYLPYVIENVPGAKMENPIMLNGAFFGMNLRRTRLFETSFYIEPFLIPKEGASKFKMGRKPQNDFPIVPVGHFSGVQKARDVMGIDWMTGKELAQAIPPAYTRYIMQQYLVVNYGR